MCVQVKPVCLALSLLHSFYNITPPSFPSALLVAFLSAHGPFARAREQKKEIADKEKKIYQKTPRWVRGEICPLEMKGQGRKTKGESACSGVELDISVSCQRLVHGCGMLMSEVSLGFFPSSLSFSTPTFLPLLFPSVSFCGRKKKRIDS